MKFKDYLQEKVDMQWLSDNVIGKKYKGKEIINAIYDDKKGEMIRFWVGKKGDTTEIRPIAKDELVKVLK